MGGLFSSLNSSLDAIESYESALNVSQNNVSNASTPGYASQTATLEALPFDPSSGLSGGVQTGPTQSTQNQYADQAVRSQLEQQGYYNSQSTALSSIQSLFDVTGQTGVIGAVNNLLQSFSAWSTTPTSVSAQQAVLTSAQAVAQNFQSAAATLSQTTTGVNQQISSTVQQINTLAASIQSDNIAIQQGDNTGETPDAGLEANLSASLDSLSQLVNTTVTYAPDGTATVLIGGQTPLVMGTQLYSVQASFVDQAAPVNPDAIPDAHILDSQGNDITSQISQGSLGGLLYVRNSVLPALRGDGQQQGALNQLAQTLADSVNGILTSAQTPGGQPGTALFTYSSASPVDVASTLTLNPNISASTLAPAQPGADNGAALELSNLGNSTAPSDQISGQTILQFMDGMATQAGQQVSDAQSGENLHTQLLTQAQALQTQIEGVSLDGEAVQVMELQKGFQAAGQMVSVIDNLTLELINMATPQA